MTDEEKMAHKLALKALENQDQADGLMKPAIQERLRSFSEWDAGGLYSTLQEAANHIDALEAEIKKRGLETHSAIRQLRKFKQQRDELAKLLQMYGEHLDVCSAYPCSCGLDEALSKLEDSQDVQDANAALKEAEAGGVVSFEEFVKELEVDDFEEWYSGVQGHGLRCELIWDDLKPSNIVTLKKWLLAAFEEGRHS